MVVFATAGFAFESVDEGGACGCWEDRREVVVVGPGATASSIVGRGASGCGGNAAAACWCCCCDWECCLD